MDGCAIMKAVSSNFCLLHIYYVLLWYKNIVSCIVCKYRNFHVTKWLYNTIFMLYNTWLFILFKKPMQNSVSAFSNAVNAFSSIMCFRAHNNFPLWLDTKCVIHSFDTGTKIMKHFFSVIDQNNVRAIILTF